MDFQISTKEERLQPEGLIDVYVNDVFDLYPTISEDGYIETVNTVTERKAELQQAALFASLKQRGGNSLDKNAGVRWSEAMLGELNPDVILSDIRNAVAEVSTSCAVIFGTVTDSQGNQYLTYDIKVTA